MRLCRPDVFALEAAQVNEKREQLADEIITGGGVVRIRRALPLARPGEAKAVLEAAPARRDGLRERVFDLLGLGSVFVWMAEHEVVLDLIFAVLGDQARLGSISARRIRAGGAGQDPHIEYPYFDLYNT